MELKTWSISLGVYLSMASFETKCSSYRVSIVRGSLSNHTYVCSIFRSKDATVRLWNVPVPPAPLFTPVALRHQPDPADARDITAIDWDRTGARLATGCYDGVVRVWTAEGAHQFNLKFHQGPIFTNRWSPDASFLLSASLDGTVVVWDMMTLKPDKIQQLFRVHSGT